MSSGFRGNEFLVFQDLSDIRGMFGADFHYSVDLRGTNVTSDTGTAGPKNGGGSVFLAGNSLLFTCNSQLDCGMYVHHVCF